jgi:hypothetical protein
MYTLTIYFIVLDESLGFVLIYRPHPVCKIPALTRHTLASRMAMAYVVEPFKLLYLNLKLSSAKLSHCSDILGWAQSLGSEGRRGRKERGFL